MGQLELGIQYVDAAGTGSEHSSVKCAEHTEEQASAHDLFISDRSVLQAALRLVLKYNLLYA